MHRIYDDLAQSLYTIETPAFKLTFAQRNAQLEELISKIATAQSLILSTHRQCDGDGLGAQLALFHALKKIGKKVRVVNVDPTPKKYKFLSPDQFIHYFEVKPPEDLSADLALIFDTNDERLIEPLFSSLKKSVKAIAFVDHHPVLSQGPQPTKGSVIDVKSASTGEMAYRLIQGLKIPLDREIARCLYTSITFDTQLYRFVRNSPTSHLIAAELLTHDINPEEIHRHLFGNQTVNKMAFLARALGQIEYHCHGKVAFLKLRDEDILHFGIDMDESRDVIDMIMNIESIEAAAIFREDATNKFKVSLRSKDKLEVLSIAEALGGGGHRHAAGAYIDGHYEALREKVLKHLADKIRLMD